MMMTLSKKIINQFRFDLSDFSLKFVTTNFLKIIAVIAMFVDHFAVIGVSPSHEWYLFMRQVGRIVFVIYAFLSCMAILNTRNPKIYLIRTIVMAIIFQIVLIVAGRFTRNVEPFYLNIFFVLFFGTFTIYLFNKNIWYGVIAFVSISTFYFVYVNANALFSLNSLINFTIDYSIYGYIIIVTMGICFYFKNKINMINFKVLLISVFVLVNFLFYYVAFSDIHWARFWNVSNVQIYCLTAIPFFLFYNQKDHFKNRYVKWAFITAYPLSFLLPTLIFL